MDMCVSGWLGTYFNGDSYGKLPGICKLIEIYFHICFLRDCSDDKLEGLVTGVQDGDNYAVGNFLLLG